MTVIALTPATLSGRHRLHLVAALVFGIAIGSIAGAGLTQSRPAESGAQQGSVPVADAPALGGTGRATTSASEQYRAQYTESHAPAASTSASEQYRAPYGSRGVPAASTTASEQYRASYTGEE